VGKVVDLSQLPGAEATRPKEEDLSNTVYRILAKERAKKQSKRQNSILTD
jgi:hypothetical protein